MGANMALESFACVASGDPRGAASAWRPMGTNMSSETMLRRWVNVFGRDWLPWIDEALLFGSFASIASRDLWGATSAVYVRATEMGTQCGKIQGGRRLLEGC